MTTIQNQIALGSIVTVKDADGYYRISKLTKNTVNLRSVFGTNVYYKGLDKTLVIEAGDAFYEQWSKSETYRCM